MKKTALILVDIQNDFLPGGALAVKNSDQIFPAIKKLLTLSFDFIIATKDWHPLDHLSFAANHHKLPGEKISLGDIEQILWPIHCVQETKGAELSSHLSELLISKIIHKGTDKNIDSYSTFFDNKHNTSTGLDDYLLKNHIQELYIAGLATDYCIKHSVLDALKLNFKTFVVVDGCQGVNLNPQDSQQALEEMKAAGAILTTSTELQILSPLLGF